MALQGVSKVQVPDASVDGAPWTPVPCPESWAPLPGRLPPAHALPSSSPGHGKLLESHPSFGASALALCLPTALSPPPRAVATQH